MMRVLNWEMRCELISHLSLSDFDVGGCVKAGWA